MKYESLGKLTQYGCEVTIVDPLGIFESFPL